MRLSLVALLVIFVPHLLAQTTFSDGFEEDLSRWELLGNQGGTIEISNLQSHSGSHSLLIQTTQVGGTGESKKKYVRHVFTQPTRGAVSVWFYDPGVPNAALVVLWDASGEETSMGRMDADGSASPGYVYRFGGLEHAGGVPYSAGWHNFTMTVTSEGTTYAIDGVTQVADNPDFVSFKELWLGTFFGVSTVQFWDDVSVQPACTLPKPTITAPASNHNFQTARPSFSWNAVAGADRYAVQILSGETVLLEKTDLVAPDFTPETDLASDIYTFRVKAAAADCESEWSSLPFLVGSTPVTVTVKVTGQEGPLPGAKVSLVPGGASSSFISVDTDGEGMAVFENIVPGSYSLKVDKEFYAPYLATLSIDKPTTIEVQLGLSSTLSMSPDKTSYDCGETITLVVRGSPGTSIALMVKLGDEVVYTDTVSTDDTGVGSSSFAISKEGTLLATASVAGATAEALFTVGCAPQPPAKISVQIEAYATVDGSQNPKSTFDQGQMVNFFMVIKNESSVTVTALVLNQVKDPRLTSVFTGYVKVTLAPGERQEVSLGFSLPGDARLGTYTSQAMVWSDWASSGGIAYDSLELTFGVEGLV